MRGQNESIRLVSRHRAGQHVDRAERLERAGRWDEAMAEFKKAVEIDPCEVDALIALGYHYRRKGLLAKAAEAFRMAAGLSDDFESTFNLGHVLVDLGRYEQAEEVFQRCLKHKPDDPSVCYEVAYAQYSSARYDEALAGLDRLVKVYPDDWEMLFLRASCQWRKGLPAEAEVGFRRALAATPDEEARALVLEQLSTVMRYREFPGDVELGVKDRVYRDFGAVCLGSAADDGLDIPHYTSYAFTVHDLAVTLWRFVSVYESLNRVVSVVLPGEAQALPLAIAVAELLDLAVIPLSRLHEDDLPLVVMGVCSGPELHDLILERVPNDSIVLSMAVDWSSRTEFMTDIVGVFTQQRSSLPWEAGADWERWWCAKGALSTFLRTTRAGKAISASATRLLREVQRLAPEPNLLQQVAYYTTLHRQLRPPLALE